MCMFSLLVVISETAKWTYNYKKALTLNAIIPEAHRQIVLDKKDGCNGILIITWLLFWL